VGDDPIDAAALAAEVSRPAAGAVVLFVGAVRDHSEGRSGVSRLSFEVYPEMVEAVIAEIAAAACEKWPLLAVAIEHRSGDVAVGEASVAVAASSAHRADAFEAVRHLIDELKARAPIWKKEHWPGGAEWVGGPSGPPDGARGTPVPARPRRGASRLRRL